MHGLRGQEQFLPLSPVYSNDLLKLPADRQGQHDLDDIRNNIGDHAHAQGRPHSDGPGAAGIQDHEPDRSNT